MHYPIVMFGNKETTKYMLEYIHKQVRPIDLIVTVADDKNSAISGYTDLQTCAEKFGIPVYIVSSYSLKDKKDVDFFTNNSFDLGISVGWQRIIPAEVLSQFKSGVFGFHGSAGHLPFGKGRSPLNWSLIKGHTRFINHCFQYNPKPDDGKIFSTEMFEINEFDTIQTLQYKVLLVGKKQLTKLIECYQNDTIPLFPQSKNHHTFYPKRTPDDGKIDLTASTSEIYNLIRGVTHPFPGAFLLSADQKKLLIWEAYPFDQFIDTFDFSVGEVIDTFGKEAVVKTIDGSILIKRYTFDREIRKGELFH
ncbi:methionyl-tRNA formyltransferase [Oceanobacillus salinisoli]|uniref:methionyl-tRNA formyltransferase n=1 Tax=Oceanobacillus salinisoli TaxID=2678611 RepID=UPI0012E1B38A|nr:formyltransferase family protein [Oceanobacillus salinisoli]